MSTLGSQVLFARLLPRTEFGSFVILSSLVSSIGAMASLGLRPTLVREVSKALAQGRSGEARRAVYIGLFWGTLGSLVAALLLNVGLGSWLALRVFKDPALGLLMGIAGTWVVAVVVQSLVSESYRGFQDIHRASLYGGPLSGLLLLAFLWPAFHFNSSFSLGLGTQLACIAAVVGALFPLPFLLKRLLTLKGKAHTRSRDFLRQAWPVLAANIAGLLVSRADLWTLGAWRPKEEVGLYAPALALSALVSMSLMIVNGVLPPMISELHAKGERDRLERVLRKIAGLSGLSALVIYLGLFMTGPWLLDVLYGNPDFSRAWPALVVLGLGQVVNVVTGSCGFTLLMTGHQRAFMLLTLGVGALSVGLMIGLAPAYGIMGVASAAAFGTAALNMVLLLYTRFKVGVWTQASWLPPYGRSTAAVR